MTSHPPQPALDAATTQPSPYRVVVLAEDDPQLRRTLSDFLADEGFLVRETAHVGGVETALREATPHAIVLDLHLKDGDADRILAQLGDEGPHTILISASARAETVARSHRVRLLRKPFDLELLVEALLVPLDDRATRP